MKTLAWWGDEYVTFSTAINLEIPFGSIFEHAEDTFVLDQYCQSAMEELWGYCLTYSNCHANISISNA